MFVFSLKANNIKRILLIALAAVFVIICGYMLITDSLSESKAAGKDGISCKASNAEERINFLDSFGLKVKNDPLEVEEIIIPDEFDETYEKYNAVQQEQGFDLSKYKGQRVKKWTYEVTNYPGYEDSEGVIRAELLISKNTVIGCDIYSMETDGFIKALSEFKKSE